MEQATGYTLRDIFHVLFKRKWVIAVFFLSTVAAGAFLATAFNVVLYQATAQILVSPGREHLADLTLSANALVPPRMSFDLEEQTARTTAMLTGRYLSEQLVQKIGAARLCRESARWILPVFSSRVCDPTLDPGALADRVIAQVQDNIHAERVGSAALVNLTFRHTDPALAAEVVNTLGTLYLDRHLGVLKDPRGEEFLQEQAEALKQRVQQTEKEFEAFKLDNGIHSSIKDDQGLIVAELVALEAQRNELISRAADETSRLSRRRSAPGGGTINSDIMLAMRGRLLDLQRRETELSSRLGDRNPDLLALRQEIRKVQTEITAEDHDQHRTEVNALQARQSSLDVKIAQLRRRSLALDRLEPEFSRLQQHLQANQQNYRLYLAKTEEARVSDAMDAQKIASVRVIDAAKAPLRPLSSKSSFMILLAAIFGLLGGVALSFILEIFGDRLETAERAESVLEIPVLASIPILRLK